MTTTNSTTRNNNSNNKNNESNSSDSDGYASSSSFESPVPPGVEDEDEADSSKKSVFSFTNTRELSNQTVTAAGAKSRSPATPSRTTTTSFGRTFTWKNKNSKWKLIEEKFDQLERKRQERKRQERKLKQLSKRKRDALDAYSGSGSGSDSNSDSDSDEYSDVEPRRIINSIRNCNDNNMEKRNNKPNFRSNNLPKSKDITVVKVNDPTLTPAPAAAAIRLRRPLSAKPTSNVCPPTSTNVVKSLGMDPLSSKSITTGKACTQDFVVHHGGIDNTEKKNVEDNRRGSTAREYYKTAAADKEVSSQMKCDGGHNDDIDDDDDDDDDNRELVRDAKDNRSCEDGINNGRMSYSRNENICLQANHFCEQGGNLSKACQHEPMSETDKRLQEEEAENTEHNVSLDAYFKLEKKCQDLEKRNEKLNSDLQKALTQYAVQKSLVKERHGELISFEKRLARKEEENEDQRGAHATGSYNKKLHKQLANSKAELAFGIRNYELIQEEIAKAKNRNRKLTCQYNMVQSEITEVKSCSKEISRHGA